MNELKSEAAWELLNLGWEWDAVADALGISDEEAIKARDNRNLQWSAERRKQGQSCETEGDGKMNELKTEAAWELFDAGWEWDAVKDALGISIDEAIKARDNWALQRRAERRNVVANGSL